MTRSWSAPAYDAAGNRTSVGGSWARTGLPPALTSATYDAANRITAWGGTSFSYDLNGNLTGDGTNTYTWNARDQLASLSGGTSASFVYDGLGRRRGKTISGATTNFLYDGLNFVQEQSSGGTPTANLLTGLGIDETFTRTDGAAGEHVSAGEYVGDRTDLVHLRAIWEDKYLRLHQYERGAVHRARERWDGALFLSGPLLQPRTAAVHQRRSSRFWWRR
jgi:YD repeat-containing protein